MHALRGDQCSLLTRIDSDVLAVSQAKEGRQRSASLYASLSNVLRKRLQNLDRGRIRFDGLLGIDVCERGIGGAKIDSDIHFVGGRLFDFELCRFPSTNPGGIAGKSTFDAFQPLCLQNSTRGFSTRRNIADDELHCSRRPNLRPW